MDAIVYDEITTQIGDKDDVADAAGSMHAKIAELRNYFGQEIPKAFAGRLTYVSVIGVEGWNSIIRSQDGPSYIGAGRIRAIKLLPRYKEEDEKLLARIVVVIDGVTLDTFAMDFGDAFSCPNTDYSVWCDYDGVFGTAGKNNKIALDIPFQTGFTSTIYYKHATASSTYKPEFVVEFEAF